MTDSISQLHQLECDEQALNVVDAVSGTVVTAVPWPPEVYTEEGEPDYEWLTETMAEMVERDLDGKGFKVNGDIMRAVRLAVEPGGPHDPLLFKVVPRITDPPHSAAGGSFGVDPGDYQPAAYSGDSVDVPVKHGSVRYVPRHLTVEILDTGQTGNRYTDVPSISLMEYGRWQVLLTWNEAKALAQAITDVVGVAENG